MVELGIQRSSTKSTPSIASPLSLVAYLIILVWGLWAGRNFFIPLCLSTLIAVLMLPAIRWMVRRKAPEWLAIVLATILLAFPFVVGAYVLLREGKELVLDIPKVIQFADGWLQRLAESEWALRYNLRDSITLSKLSERLTSSAGASAALALAGVGSLANSASLFVLILIIAVVMVSSRHHLYTSISKVMERFETIHTDNMLEAGTTLIEQFLIARMVIMVVMGAASGLTIFAFGVPYAFVLGSVIGLLTFIPAIGFVLSLIPLLLVAASTGFSFLTILSLVSVIFLIHVLEGNVLSPKLIGQKLNINTLTTLIGIFGGGLLWGAWGMLLSVPILGVVRILFCASPSLRPWGELMAEREDGELRRKLLRIDLSTLPFLKKSEVTSVEQSQT